MVGERTPRTNPFAGIVLGARWLTRSRALYPHVLLAAVPRFVARCVSALRARVPAILMKEELVVAADPVLSVAAEWCGAASVFYRRGGEERKKRKEGDEGKNT